MSDKKISVLVVRLTYTGWERQEIGDFLVQTVLDLQAHPRVRGASYVPINQLDIATARNLAAQLALSREEDILVMVDNDIKPAKGFVWAAIDLILHQLDNGHGPTVVVSPTRCGNGEVNIKRVEHLDGYGEHGINVSSPVPLLEAIKRVGVEPVPLAGAALIAIHTGTFEALAKHKGLPYFYVEYADESETEIVTSEDIAFTRDCNLHGVPVVALWNYWSSHWKEQELARPTIDELTKAPAVRHGWNLAGRPSSTGWGLS